MSSSVQRRALSGSVANIAVIGTLLLQNIALVPVMLRYWGSELYGVWLALSALQSLLQTIDTGQQSYLGNEFNRLYHTDRLRLERLLSTGLCSISILGLLQVLLVFAFYPGNTLGRILGLPLDAHSHTTVWLSLLVFVIGWIFSGSAGGLVVRLTYAVGYYARFSWWGVVQRIVLIVGVVIAVHQGAGLLVGCIVYSGVQIAINVLMLLDMIRILKRVGIRWQPPSFGLAASTFGKSLLLTATGLIDSASTSGLFTLVASLFSAAMLPTFATLRTLANVVLQCVSTIVTPLLPEMSRYSARNEIGKLNEMTAVCWLLAGTIINGGLLCSIACAEPVYVLWTHGKLPFREDLFFLLAISISLKSIGAPWFGYLVCTNALGEQFWVTALRGGIALGVTYLLAFSAGLRGVGIALVGAEFVASLLVPLIFIHREFRRRGYSVPWRSFGLACASLFVVAMAFAVSSAKLVPAGVTVASGMILIFILSLAQWRVLLPETRTRLTSMVSRDRKEALAAAG